MQSIQYLLHDAIDKVKWDDCVNNAGNSIIYANSFYLDAMAKHWDALVLNDYEAVMPLTWNKKYGFYYLYQPPFTASLGIFGNNLSAAVMQSFLTAVPKKFKYWDIYFNHGNYLQVPGFDLYERKNFILPLHDTYSNLYNQFKTSTQRNIKKFEQLGTAIKKDIPIGDIIALSKLQAQSFAALTNDDFSRLTGIYQLLYQQHKAITYGAYINNMLVASAAFFLWGNRAYYILVGNHPNGKTAGASHALINAFIKDHAGKNLLLDFEGSDIPSLAFFYSSFNAVEEKYSGITLNRLPWIARLLKK